MAMQVVRLSLIPTSGGEVASSNLGASHIADCFYVLSEPNDRLEHIHVRYELWIIILTIFTGHASSELAEAAAKSMCQRILATFPSLSGWQLCE